MIVTVYVLVATVPSTTPVTSIVSTFPAPDSKFSVVPSTTVPFILTTIVASESDLVAVSVPVADVVAPVYVVVALAKAGVSVTPVIERAERVLFISLSIALRFYRKHLHSPS